LYACSSRSLSKTYLEAFSLTKSSNLVSLLEEPTKLLALPTDYVSFQGSEL
jgi:hypothetical protein